MSPFRCIRCIIIALANTACAALPQYREQDMKNFEFRKFVVVEMNAVDPFWCRECTGGTDDKENAADECAYVPVELAAVLVEKGGITRHMHTFVSSLGCPFSGADDDCQLTRTLQLVPEHFIDAPDIAQAAEMLSDFAGFNKNEKGDSDAVVLTSGAVYKKKLYAALASAAQKKGVYLPKQSFDIADFVCGTEFVHTVMFNADPHVIAEDAAIDESPFKRVDVLTVLNAATAAYSCDLRALLKRYDLPELRDDALGSALTFAKLFVSVASDDTLPLFISEDADDADVTAPEDDECIPF